MPLVQLRHDKRLGYAGSGRRSLPALPADVRERVPGATVVSFRPPARGRPDIVVRKMHGCRRWPALPGTDLVFYGLETDSPLAPLLMWDAAHGLPVGSAITVMGEALRPSFLQRAYFARDLVVEHEDADRLVLRKRAPLPAERDAGLDRWSFCIPVGPEDATLLNVVVRRILELDVPTKEILLCGRPGANFLYGDQVRIVGEEITAPPVRICTKKNRLAQEAQYENLCIIHDRVFLPSDFHAAVRRFGDHFPMVAFQSLYFDDRYNAVPRRYSDFNIAPRVRAQATRGLKRDNDPARMSAFSPATLAVTEEQGFYYANPLRHSGSVYATGSLYLCKRSVWLTCPQDETLHWTEFEDIDQGLRAEALGIPSRVNPYAITQSLNSRPLLSVSGAVEFETMGGASKKYRAWFEPLPIPRKPLLKVTTEQGQRLLARFAQRYAAPGVPAVAPANAVMNSRARLRALLQATHRMRVPIQRKAIDALLTDYEKQLVFDQSPFAWREWMSRQFLAHGSAAVVAMVRDNNQLLNHCSQRTSGEIFAEDMRQYLPKPGLGLLLGSLVSALIMTVRNRGLVYMPGNYFTRLGAILRTTPFARYAERTARAVNMVVPLPVARAVPAPAAPASQPESALPAGVPA